MSGTLAQRLASRDRIIKYVEVVKETLQDRKEKYDEFLSLMKCLDPQRTDVAYLLGRLKELFKEHPQLILGYNSLVCKELQITLPPVDALESAKQLDLNDGDSFSRKVQGRSHDRERIDTNVQQKRNNVPMKDCEAQRFYQGAQGTENNECNMYNRETTTSGQEVMGQNMSLYSSDEYLHISIKELDLSNCKSCTPSYRILPKNYTLPSVSRRTDIGAQVLNDHCILVTSGSEDFKHMRKNQYEKTLFQCEDDRFELDMFLELVHSTSVRIQELLGKIRNSSINTDHPFRIKDYLTARNLRCIERLYGDHWLDVMDELRKNAPLTLSVILSRLKKKQVEWKSCRSVFNKVWAETLAKNYHKSLDHRSCYFKQQDSKSLSTKALVSEIQERYEKQKQLEDASVESIVARSRQPIIPHMEFEFPDPDIHEDLYRLIKYSCEDYCSREQADNLMKIWTTFLEPVLGVPHRPKDAEDTGNSTCNSVEEQGLSSGGSAITNQKQSDVSGNGDGFTLQPSSQICLDYGITVEHDGPPHHIDHMGDICTKVIPSLNQKMPQDTGSLQRCEQSMTHLGTERKEGNLSSYRDDESEKFAVCSGGSIETASYTEDYLDNKQLGIGHREGIPGDAGEHFADNDYVESAIGSQKTSQSVDVSGSDLADFSSKEPDSEGDGGQMSSRPLNELVPLALHEKDISGLIFYGNASFYVLFRLHQTLYERIQKAKLYSSSTENRLRSSNDKTPTDSSYERLMDAIYRFLDGSFDNAEFEDVCRSIIGTHSYLLCTIDRLIYKVIKQLQNIATGEAEMRLVQLHAYEKSRNPACFADMICSANARLMLPDDNIYRIVCVGCGSRLTIQLMDYRNDELIRSTIYGHDKPKHITNFKKHQFAAYVNNDLLSDVPEEMETHGIYLKRNKRKTARGDESDTQLEALEGVVIVNALDIQISPRTLKASYVTHTQDFMYRRKKRRVIL